MTDSTFLPSDDTEADTVLTILNPQNGSVVRGAALGVSGTMLPGGWLLPVSIHELVDGQWRYIGASPPFIGPIWMAIFATTPGPKTIVARVVGSTEIESAPVTFTYIFEALLNIISPTEGSTVGPVGELVVTGSGKTGETVHLFTSDQTLALGSAVVGDDHLWRVVVDQNLYPHGGEIKIMAATDMAHWTPVRTFNLIPIAPPVITQPAANAPTDVRGPVSGTGHPGSEISVLRDLQHSFVVGRGTVSENKQWSITQWVNDMPPGPFGIIARQSFEGRVIDSAARHFNVRPPALTKVDIDFPTSTTVGFSGSGYYDAGARARVEIRFKVPAQVNLPPAVQVDANGHWQTTATGWPPGDYSLIAVQMVEDRAGGWIESTAYEFVVKKGLPDVTDVEHTQDYQPTFSGRGVSGALVYVVKNGGALEAPETLVGPSGSWTTQALHVWGPTQDRPVYIQQRKDGLTSKDWFEYKVTIAPLPPEIDTPPAIGLTPEFSGTCWRDSLITLTFSDSATVHTVDGVNGIWKYRRREPFTSGVSYTISAQQTAAEQLSDTKTLPFTVRRPMSTPQITEPAERAEVGHQITVRGSDGMAGATLKLRHASNKQPLGEAKVLSSDGVWEIALSDLDFERYDDYSIEAIQTIGSDTSPVSNRRGFTVAVLPPVIEVPASGENLARTSIISGKCRPFATVELEIGGQRYRNIPVNSEGFWEVEPTLPVGSKTLNARVSFNATLSKEMSVQYNVVPAPPFIETPAPGEHLGRRAVVSGFGIPGDSVAVRLGNAQGRVLGESPVLADRTWSVALASDQPGGRFGVVAVASCEGFSSADSEARTVNLGTYAPTVEQPASGRWVDNPVRFNGKGRPGSATLVSWFDPDKVWASALPVNGSGWQGEANAPLAPGGQWVRLQQTISGGAEGETHSDWVDSGRFEVQPPEPEG
ncbi:hypothetical protein [Pseudomonas sp. HMWF021]|uniref:hypothetical protein n=1 Tax=Pseudomonas sp. HMWF021 TaxID=2056857 RepID=UPI0011B28D8F|nr:hypothetical protein [Pseudomonas sp. HMWF021]